MAQQVGMDLEEAVFLVTPEAVAEIIMKAGAEADRSISSPRCGRSGSTTVRAEAARLHEHGLAAISCTRRTRHAFSAAVMRSSTGNGTSP